MKRKRRKFNGIFKTKKRIKYLATNAICIYLLFLSNGVSSRLIAQSISRQVVGSLGGSTSLTAKPVQVDWTMGEAIIGMALATDGQTKITLGFQQPDLFIIPLTNSDELLVSIFPNPTTDVIYINLIDPTLRNLSLTLSNNSGQVLLPNVRIESRKNEIDLSRFPPGVYYLKVFDEVANHQVCKIIKTK